MESATPDIAAVFLRSISQQPRHAYFLSGTGAEALAARATQILLCSHEEGRPCGQCKGCIMLAAGSHPDMWSVDAMQDPEEKTIKIASIRELIEWTGRAAQFGGRKVALLQRAHRMNEAAQNALLRTLEEPPEGVVFLLAGDESALLPTVRSRTSLIRLGEVGDPDDDPREEIARTLLTAAFQGRFVELPARYAQEKDELFALFSLQAAMLRDAIALKYEVRLLVPDRAIWLKKQPVPAVGVLRKWMEMLFDVQHRLERNANALLIIDRLCIEMKRAAQVK